jgi:glutamate 5-kinase
MRNFSRIRRVVIKIGTKTVSGGDTVDATFLDSVARQVGELAGRGLQVLIVTSGAIGIGALKLGLSKKVTAVEMRQACAAIGQPVLMNHYDRAFSARGKIIAQVLVTRDNFNHRDSYLNLKTAVETLLGKGVIPVFNENDSVSTREIGPVFGDNDTLSAHVASKLGADLLILLSDIDALYDKNPREFPDARRIDVVEALTDEIRKGAGGAGSEFSTGGMETKLRAVEIAGRAGCRTVITDGRIDNILVRILDGEAVGTLFLPGEKLSSRKRWILEAVPAGVILVDEGALAALARHKSLLPPGVKGVEGVFKSGDVVMINDRFKAVTALSSDEIRTLTGKQSSEIREILGSGRRDDIARPEDIMELA